MTMFARAHPSPANAAGDARRPGPPDLWALAGEVVRDLIRRDPALWACVQADDALWREFGFEGEAGRG